MTNIDSNLLQMNSEPTTGAGALSCFACGKPFTTHSALSHHGRSCSKGRKRVASALVKAKDAYFEREDGKKRRREEAAVMQDLPRGGAVGMPPSNAIDLLAAGEATAGLSLADATMPMAEASDGASAYEGSSLVGSLAEQRPRRVVRPPLRFRDVPPDPPAALPPPHLLAPTAIEGSSGVRICVVLAMRSPHLPLLSPRCAPLLQAAAV